MDLKQNSYNILVVDDDPFILRIIDRFLTPIGYQLQFAPNGKEALEMADPSYGSVHLLLTDVVMPGMDGEEVALKFKKYHPFSHVLFMSAYLQPATEKYEHLHGKVDFVVKPFGALKLQNKIKQLLA